MTNQKRQSGILLHPTSLPSPYGIGEIGPDAYQFIDKLYSMGQTLWQILPIGPTDCHNSPYSSISTFAGNPLLISLDLLIEDNLLNPKLLENIQVQSFSKVAYNEVIKHKMSILKVVSLEFNQRASIDKKIAFEQFCIEESYWLEDYSTYCVLKLENGNTIWPDWKLTDTQNLEKIHQIKVIQYLFHDQWSRLHNYCQAKGVKIIGDMPIYVGHDSADVYSNPKLFQLNHKGKMVYQAGSPPCQFQKDGQLWGTPVYNWKNHQKTNYEWWQRRFKKLFQMVDIIRLDHFIGYAKYFRIPISYNTAHKGEWISAPGDKLFKMLSSTINNFNVIVEDLGDVTEDVITLRSKYDFPGMHVLQFESDKILDKEDFPINSLVCTGTHDNDTILGWLETLDKNQFIKFFNCNEENVHWEFINYALGTSSNMVVLPMQDILGKKSVSRFNIPGTLSSSNWSWRMGSQELTDVIIAKMKALTEKNRRNMYNIKSFEKYN